MRLSRLPAKDCHSTGDCLTNASSNSSNPLSRWADYPSSRCLLAVSTISLRRLATHAAASAPVLIIATGTPSTDTPTPGVELLSILSRLLALDLKPHWRGEQVLQKDGLLSDWVAAVHIFLIDRETLKRSQLEHVVSEVLLEPRRPILKDVLHRRQRLLELAFDALTFRMRRHSKDGTSNFCFRCSRMRT